MTSGRSESGAIAFANVVNVDPVLAGRKLGDRYGDLDPVGDGREFGVANGGSLGIDEVGVCSLSSGGSGMGG
jgi:hypothetical protein